MSNICKRVELDRLGVAQLLIDCSGICEQLAQTVARNSGIGATVKVSLKTGRPHAFVNAPMVEASKNNSLLKAVRHD